MRSRSPRDIFPSPLVPVVQERFDTCAPHAFDPEFDLALMTNVIKLMGVHARFSLTFALSKHFKATTREVERAVKLMLHCFKLLHRCGYGRSDIEVMAAHASHYLQEYMVLTEKDGQPEMEILEVAHIFCVLMFIAHSHALDENCPLRVWHRHLFAKYCSVKMLNEAVMRMLEKLEYRLRVEESELSRRLAFLRSSSNAEAGPKL